MKNPISQQFRDFFSTLFFIKVADDSFLFPGVKEMRRENEKTFPESKCFEAFLFK